MQSPWAANKTQPIPRTPAENTAPRDRPRKIHCHSTATPAGRTQTPPQRGRARHSPRNGENSGVERARILDPGPVLMRWDACRGWQAFPRASDACDRDGSLLLLNLIVHPKGTRQVESVSADDVGRYAPPQRPAAQCGPRISAPPHGRPVKPHHIQLWSPSASCSPSPQKARACLPPPRREDCLHAGKNRGAPESAKRRDTFVPFTERRGSAGRSRTRMRAAHGQEFGGRRLRRRFAASSRHLGIREPETHRHQRLPPRQRQRQRHAAWPPSGLRRHAVSTGNRFAARPPPQDSASPRALVNGVGTAPRRGRRSGGDFCPMSAPRPVVLRRPPCTAQRYAFANPQTLRSCPPA